MNALTPFVYNDQPVRVVEIDAEPWFVLADLVGVLGFARSASAVAERLDDGVRRTYPIVDALGRTQQATIVSEAGMYEVVIRSDKPEALAFRRWITSEVLPSIRRHGGYLTPEAIEKTLSDPDFIIGLATALKAEQSKRAEAEARAAILAPKADAFDAFLSTVGDLSMNEAAKEASRGSGVIIGEHRLRDAMIRWGWVYRDGAGKPRAYQSQIECGRLAEKPQWHYHPSTGEKVLDTPQVRVTAKGVKAAADRLAHDRAEVSA